MGHPTFRYRAANSRWYFLSGLWAWNTAPVFMSRKITTGMALAVNPAMAATPFRGKSAICPRGFESTQRMSSSENRFSAESRIAVVLKGEVKKP